MARVNKEAIRRSAHLHFPEFLRSRSNAFMLDAWMDADERAAARDAARASLDGGNDGAEG